MFDPVASRIDLALAAMNAELPTGTPELDALFAKLRTARENAERRAATQRIWSVWCSHADAAAADAMRSVVEAFDSGELDHVGEVLDRMVDRWPDWAEAWNKRATLHFVEDRHTESLDDIARTLEREPRHFGALSGLGQICLGHGDLTSALLAFERVLSIDPGVREVRQAVGMLRKRAQPTIH
ncbi:MAG: tetratricopeptide repeat protein [Gammaproteobacteria bacterium]|nr:tetratricopeptide repeat protein [Gammaproteobacteria bacterium]